MYHRHNSLSALDVRRFKSRSVPTSPIHLPVQRQQSSPSPTHQSPIPERREYPTVKTLPVQIPKFSLGGEVTSIAKLNNSIHGMDALDITTKRNRFVHTERGCFFLSIIAHNHQTKSYCD